jgi:hypothetical protein
MGGPSPRRSGYGRAGGTPMARRYRMFVTCSIALANCGGE